MLVWAFTHLHFQYIPFIWHFVIILDLWSPGGPAISIHFSSKFSWSVAPAFSFLLAWFHWDSDSSCRSSRLRPPRANSSCSCRTCGIWILQLNCVFRKSNLMAWRSLIRLWLLARLRLFLLLVLLRTACRPKCPSWRLQWPGEFCSEGSYHFGQNPSTLPNLKFIER